ncbi:hypothetical protein TKK_0011634 [Trichogramma kaykai]
MSDKEEKVTAPVGSDSQVPVAEARKGGSSLPSSSSYPDATQKTVDGVITDPVKPPDARPRKDSIGAHSDTSSISTKQKRKRTSVGEEILVPDLCDLFLRIKNHIMEIQEAFLSRNRKEKCREALDAVPSTLETIRQLVLQFSNENSFLKGKVVALEAQLSKPAPPRQKTFASVVERLSARPSQQQAPEAKQTPKKKRITDRRRESGKEKFSATIRSTGTQVKRTGEEIKAELVKAVDAVSAGIGFDAIRKAADSVVVEVRSRADLEKLLTSSKLQEHGLTASKRDATVFWSRVAIFDVLNSFSEEATLGALAAQNGDVLGNRSKAELRALVKFKFKRGSKDPGKASCLVIEADPSIREALLKAKKVYLGTMRCRVGNFNEGVSKGGPTKFLCAM